MGVYKHKNGNWYCRGRINGERYHLPCTGAKDKEQAKALEDAERYKIRLKQKGLIADEKKYTFKQLMDRYIEVSEVNNKSVKTSKIFAKYLLLYFKSNTDIASIKPSDIERFKKYMLDKGKTPATVNRYLSAIKRAYNIMIADELISYNPAKTVKKLVEDNRRYTYLTKEQWNKLKVELDESILVIVICALQTGFRQSNVFQLRWEQIDMNLRFIEVKKSDNKGKKTIRKPITDLLYNLFKKMGVKKEGYVFLNPKTNKPYTNIRKSFASALKRAGIEDFHFHDLRRTVGTWLLESGVNIRTIQSILEHSDISTTERYLSITKEQDEMAMKALNDYI